mgnify:CR=1 FL=1|jgi:hypothetical protein
MCILQSLHGAEHRLPLLSGLPVLGNCRTRFRRGWSTCDLLSGAGEDHALIREEKVLVGVDSGSAEEAGEPSLKTTGLVD